MSGVFGGPRGLAPVVACVVFALFLCGEDGVGVRFPLLLHLLQFSGRQLVGYFVWFPPAVVEDFASHVAERKVFLSAMWSRCI